MKINFTKKALEALHLPERGWIYVYDSKTRGLAIGIGATGAKTFVIYRKVNGRPERIKLGRYPDLTIEQARGRAAEINAAIAKGENPADKRRKDLTFGALFEEYLERHAKPHKKSWEEDQAQFNRYLIPWRNRKVISIKRADIQRLHHEIGGRGRYAANRLLALLSSVFGKATEWGWLEGDNSTRGVKKYREQSRDRFLQADELPRFFQAVAEEPSQDIRDYVLLSLLTGARKSNVLGMRWGDVSLERGEWRIEETKNGLPQLMTLSQEAVAILRARQSDGEYVFPAHSKSGHLEVPQFGWKRILDRAGLKDLRLHDLRRSLGSWQAKTGASLSIIGKSLNHKSPSATAIYARLDLDPVRESVERATSAMLAAAGLKKPAKVSGLRGNRRG